jgi:hypothetical protein
LTVRFLPSTPPTQTWAVSLGLAGSLTSWRRTSPCSQLEEVEQAVVERQDQIGDQIVDRERLTLMPGVGHFCQLSDPDVWLASVAAFYNDELVFPR